MAKDSLSIRLCFTPWLAEFARIVRYDGIGEDDLREELKPLAEKYGEDKVALALQELTMTDEKMHWVTLTAAARKACWQVLGPPPEHPEFERYWEGRVMPVPRQSRREGARKRTRKGTNAKETP